MRHPLSRLRAGATSLFAAAAFACCASAAFAAPPTAPVRDVVETLHGVTVHDPYRYFENVKAPEVQAWLLGQGDAARQVLDRIEGREQLERRIAELSAASGDSVYGQVRMPGGRLFYMKRPRGERQFKLVMRQGLQGTEQVLFDPQREADRTGVPHAINYFMPSWDGRHVAFGLSAGGSEDASLHVLDVASGKLVGQPVPRVTQTEVAWLPDSRSLTFNQLKALKPGDADTETYLDSRVLWLRLGQGEAQARAVFGPTATPWLGLARLEVGSLLMTPGSPWVIARTTDTTQREGSLFVARVDQLGLPRVPWRKFASFDDHIVDIELKGNDLYLRTRNGAPRYRIMKLDLRQPELARAREVAAAPADGVLEGFVLTRDSLVAAVRQGTAIGLRRYAAGDTAGRPVALPFVGAARLQDDPAHAHADLLYTLSGWTQPPRSFVLSGDSSTPYALGAVAQAPALPDVEVTDVQVPSHDGVRVPVTLLHRRGLVLDGGNPTLLQAYGSYGMSETAHYSAADMAWIELGGVLAVANVRGSGVLGHDWREAGFKNSKPNTWKDGIACAEYLIARGYASPATMSVIGGSAGGIFVGRSITSAPQLFAAAISVVGVLDAVRAEDSANGITNVSEFGSYRNAAEFPALLEMSTYHQIQDGTPYPAVMLVHGMNDPRVDVWQSAKAAARFQAATGSGKPVLLRLDAQAGHGMGSTANQRYAMAADMYSFLLWQMGKRRGPAPAATGQ